MASKAQLVDDIMLDIGKSSSKIRQMVEQHVGDVTVELLSRQNGRFKSLAKTITITLNTSYDHYKLPSDYGAASKTFVQVDSSDDFVRRLAIESEEAVYERMEHSEYAGVWIGWVVHLTTGPTARGYTGRGWYLRLPTEPSDTGFYKFFYYRAPTEEDTDLIRSSSIVKRGALGRLPRSLNAETDRDAAIYENMKRGFKEDITRHQPNIKIHPNARTRRHNAMMHEIGKGRN